MGKFDAKIDQVCKDSQIFKKDLMASINFDIENEQNYEDIISKDFDLIWIKQIKRRL